VARNKKSLNVTINIFRINISLPIFVLGWPEEEGKSTSLSTCASLQENLQVNFQKSTEVSLQSTVFRKQSIPLFAIQNHFSPTSKHQLLLLSHPPLSLPFLAHFQTQKIQEIEVEELIHC
jgi:hypothetical protein